MSYEKYDAVLFEWAKEHSLPVDTHYRDDEVRSLSLVSNDGKKMCQIWLDPESEGASVSVHVWDYKKASKVFTADENTLADALQKAYETAVSWLNRR